MNRRQQNARARAVVILRKLLNGTSTTFRPTTEEELEDFVDCVILAATPPAFDETPHVEQTAGRRAGDGDEVK